MAAFVVLERQVSQRMDSQTKYAAKGEPRPSMLTQAFNSIVQNLDSNSDPRRAFKKVVMKSLGERDYAAQETMHHYIVFKTSQLIL